MSLHVLADHMASKGRNGDSMLVHMTPGEVAGLHALALKHGGSLTINPETGLPEASFLKSLLPMLAGAALNFFAPGVGTAIGSMLGTSAAVGAGVAVGGITSLATGSLSKGLMAGLGAYGGFGLGEALTGAGTSAGLTDALAGSTSGVGEQVAGDIAATQGSSGQAFNEYLKSNANPATMSTADKLAAGWDAVKNDPMAFAKNNLGNIAAAASPILADQMVPTTTKMATPTDTGNIRKFSYDPYAQRYTPQGVFPAAGYKGGMAGGGIVALADGGLWSAADFKKNIYAGGANDDQATRVGLQYAADKGLNAQQTTDLWNDALGTSFTTKDYDRVMAAYGIKPTTSTTTDNTTTTTDNTSGNTTGGNTTTTTDNTSGNTTGGNTTTTSGNTTGGNTTSTTGNTTNTTGGLSNLITSLATTDSTANDFLKGTSGYSQTDVTNALKNSGLSGAAQYALTHQNIGDTANTAETYGGLKGLSNNINYWLQNHEGASANDIRAEMAKWDLTEEDFKRATGKTVAEYATGALTDVVNPPVGSGGDPGAEVNPNGTISTTALHKTNVITNPDGTKTVMPTNTISDIKNLYTRGGGSTGYVVNAPKTMAEFNQRFNTFRPDSDSEAAYNYLMGKGAYPTKSNVGEIMKPYSEAVLGIPQDLSTKKYLYDAVTHKMVLNPDYKPMSFDTKGVQSFGLSTNDVKKYLNANNTATDAQIYAWALANNINPDQIAAALGADPAVIRAKWDAVKGTTGGTTGTTGTVSADGTKVNVSGTDYSLLNPSVKPPGNWKWDNGGDMTPGMWVKADVAMADGGITGSGQLNLNIPLNLGGNSGGYSAAGSGSGAGFGSLPPDFAAKLGAGLSNNVAQSGLPDFRSQMQGLDAKIQQLPSVMAYNDYGKSISGRAPTADEMAQMDRLRNAIVGDTGYTDLQSQMRSLDSKYQQQAMGNQSAGLQQRYMRQAPNVSSFAAGGYALGGLGSLGGYSDGGRLLKGPGDGVSDSIPATIGAKGQPARLADGEFVVPARIVSELGNGSTEAGARKLYAMMDRVQKARGKTTGKNKVAANSRADKYLPA